MSLKIPSISTGKSRLRYWCLERSFMTANSRWRSSLNISASSIGGTPNLHNPSHTALQQSYDDSVPIPLPIPKKRCPSRNLTPFTSTSHPFPKPRPLRPACTPPAPWLTACIYARHQHCTHMIVVSCSSSQSLQRFKSPIALTDSALFLFPPIGAHADCMTYVMCPEQHRLHPTRGA